MPTLGIIGCGNFGRFCASVMAPHMQVLICDAQQERLNKTLPEGVEPAEFAAVAAADIVVPAVPFESLESVAIQLGKHIRPGAIVVDVTSVKTRPLELLDRLLPQHADLIGTHPLFGPESGASGVSGLRIAVCPVDGRMDIPRLERFRTFLDQTLELIVVQTTPREHDQQMAFVQGLTHLIGWAFKQVDPPDSDLATLAYERMLSLEHNVEHDSEALFRTIQNANPFAESVRGKFLEALATLDARIRSED